MIVQAVECMAQAVRAKGVVVIIDVFRSGTVACYAANAGVNEYYAVDSYERARELAKAKDGLVIGEQEDLNPDDFDLFNSPTLLMENIQADKALVHSTNAGTRGLTGAVMADEVLVGSFVNAAAVVEYLKQKQPELVTLVAMGTGGVMRAQEDMMCAMYLKNELEEYPNSFETLKSFLAGVNSAEMFFDESRTDVPESDFEMCMDLDKFSFVLRADSESEGVVRLHRVDVDISEGTKVSA